MTGVEALHYGGDTPKPIPMKVDASYSWVIDPNHDMMRW
jgi:hypothetical protein